MKRVESYNFNLGGARIGLDRHFGSLLVGGATTSRAHTAVKVDPRYEGPVVWVKDASRSVPVAAALLNDTLRPTLMADVDTDFAALRARHATRHDRPVEPGKVILHGSVAERCRTHVVREARVVRALRPCRTRSHGCHDEQSSAGVSPES